jgi:hypothetical protein
MHGESRSLKSAGASRREPAAAHIDEVGISALIVSDLLKLSEAQS